MANNNYTPEPVTSGFGAEVTINSNFTKIAEALDAALSRISSQDNAMEVELDMNSRRILNLPEPTNPTDVVRLQDVEEINRALVISIVDKKLEDFVPTSTQARYKDVSEMAGDLSLEIGALVETLEHTEGFGYEGGNLFEIVAGSSGTHDNGSFIDLDNGLQARGLFPYGVEVQQFGAGGGDQTTDQAAFEAALAFSKVVRMGPSPSPYILDRLDIPDHTTLYGVGDQSKILLAPGDKGDTDETPAGAIRVVGKTGVRLEKFHVDGNKSNVTGTNLLNIEAINLDSCTDCLIYDVTTVDALSEGVDFDDCVRCYAYRCRGSGCGGNAVHISNGSEDCHSISCEAYNCGHDQGRGGFDCYQGSSNSSIQNCTTRSCNRGAFADGPGSWIVNHTSIGDVNGIRLGENCRVEGGDVRDSLDNGMTLAGAGASATGVNVTGSAASGISVLSPGCMLVGCRSVFNTSYGLNLAGGVPAGSTLVTGCYILGNTGSGGEGGNINDVTRMTGAGNMPDVP